jgi:hypothetical protein
MSVQEKLQKGRNILQKAGNDPDLLGLALASIHGALEDACRNWLAQPQFIQQHRINVQNRSQASWQTLLQLMQTYGGWSMQEVQYVSKMNSLRNQTAHGDGYSGTRQQLEQYLYYIEKRLSIDTTSSATSSSSSDRYFPNNIKEGGVVSPYRFYIRRSDRGVKIFNLRGATIISSSVGSKNILASGNLGSFFVILIIVFFFALQFANELIFAIVVIILLL